MKTQIDYNSSRNQDIKEKFVRTEVIQHVGELMKHLIQEVNDTRVTDYMDELLSLAGQPDYEGAAENEGWVYNEGSGNWTHPDSDEDYHSAEDICIEAGLEPEWFEPYEYWIVSDYLGKRLKDKGEIVEEVFGLTIWGRLTTGQAILLDHVISMICEEMEILEGQKYEWK